MRPARRACVVADAAAVVRVHVQGCKRACLRATGHCSRPSRGLASDDAEPGRPAPEVMRMTGANDASPGQRHPLKKRRKTQHIDPAPRATSARTWARGAVSPSAQTATPRLRPTERSRACQCRRDEADGQSGRIVVAWSAWRAERAAR